MGSDQVGWRAIDALVELGLRAAYPAGLVSLEKLDRPGVSLLQHMRGADLAIIIDALICGPRSDIVVLLHQDEIATQEGLLSGHGLGVADAIALGAALGDLPRRLRLLGVVVERTDAVLSNDVELKAEVLAGLQGHIRREIELVADELRS